MDEDEYIDIQLRTPEAIAARLFITEALTLRFVAEGQSKAGEPVDEGPEEIFYDLLRVLRDAGMAHALAQSDKRLLKTKLGRMSSDDLMTLMNQTLAADSIAMSCGLIPWRPFWAIVEQDSHFRLDMDEDSIPEVAARLTLPSDEDIALAQGIAEFWTWRLYWEFELRQNPDVDRIKVLTLVHESMREADNVGLITLGEDGDMMLEDTPVSAIGNEMLGWHFMFAMMREKSINWLCGLGPNWDRVPSINA